MYYEFFFIFPKERELFESFLLDTTHLALEESSLDNLKAFDDEETIEFVSQSSWRYFTTHDPLKENLKENPHTSKISLFYALKKFERFASSGVRSVLFELKAKLAKRV